MKQLSIAGKAIALLFCAALLVACSGSDQKRTTQPQQLLQPQPQQRPSLLSKLPPLLIWRASKRPLWPLETCFISSSIAPH